MPIRTTLLLIITLYFMTPAMAQEKTYYKDTETLPYSVTMRFSEDAEVRDYPPALAVATNGNSSTGAFQLLFRYISGDNTANNEIAMTSPVMTDEKTERGEKIAMTSPVERSTRYDMMFFLPSQFTIKTAPKPTHPDVVLVEIPQRTLAAITYSGFNNQEQQQEKMDELMALLAQNGFDIVGKPSYLGYDSPFTLPWNKRHEIIIPVTKYQQGQP